MRNTLKLRNGCLEMYEYTFVHGMPVVWDAYPLPPPRNHIQCLCNRVQLGIEQAIQCVRACLLLRLSARPPVHPTSRLGFILHM